jgi:hypothetical protein
VPADAIRTINLDNLNTVGGEMSSQVDAIRAGAFDPDADHFAESSQPARQLVVARLADLELLDTQHSTAAIDRGRDMHQRMRVHTAAHQTRLYHCHVLSLLFINGKGRHALVGTAGR